MKISSNWLRGHVDLALTGPELEAHLLRLGFEIAGVSHLGPKFSGVVVGKVLSKEKHPNADKLSVCVVDDGSQRWNVVCGAPNVAAGQTVAFARVGAALPGGHTIGKAKLRGVESQGMICSREELGLGKDGGGIWVLDEGPAPGTDVGSMLGPADDILEVEVTSNRPDCLSHRGLARELAASLGLPLKPLQFSLDEASASLFPVSVQDEAACPYYSARVIEGVKVGPSPEGLARRLEAVGLRPVNNVVDATNFVLHALGQPLHAFDADRLAGGRLVVRRSKPGEKLRALDHKEYALPEGLLVIADAEKAVALAGVMGGEETAVTESTTRVVLESAYFAPSEVRRSSQATRLRSDSSYRFERGADPAGAGVASARAASLIVESAGGRAGKLSEAAGPPPTRPTVRVGAARLNRILGASFPDAEIVRVLTAIAAELTRDGDDIVFLPPSWRADLATANDLAEEVGRFLGYDSVPYRLAPLAPRAATLSPVETASRRARSRLAALGLWEAYNYDLLPKKTLEACRLPSADLPHVANPLSEDWAVLRPSLLPGLLKSAQHNLSRGADAVRLFEVGKVYDLDGGEVRERWRVAGVLLGPVLDARWQPARAPRAGFPDAKAAVEDLLSHAGTPTWTALDADHAVFAASDPVFHPANALRALVGGAPAAAVGWLHPRVARAFDLEREGAVVFEADLDWLAAHPPRVAQFQPFSPLPVSRRDLALVVDKTVAYASVETAVRGCSVAELQDVALFDVYEGKGVPDGHKSLAIRLTFGRSDRTLTDAEVSGFTAVIVAALAAKVGAALRS